MNNDNAQAFATSNIDIENAINDAKAIISADLSQCEDSTNEYMLTEEQIKQVYDSLDEVNPDADKLAAAQQQTEEAEHTEIEEIEPFDQSKAETVIPEDVVKSSILGYDLGFKDDEALELAKLVLEYKQNRNIKLYDRLSDNSKKVVNNIIKNINTPTNRTNRISKENAARFFVESFLNDSELQMALDEFSTNINDAYSQIDSEMSKLFNEAYDEVFNNIDEIREDDPEKAKRIEIVKESFKMAMPPFPKLMEFINPKTRKIIYKKAEFTFSSETSYFNSKVNVTDIKVPNITDLLEVIKLYDPSRKDIEIKRFIIAICRHVYNHDFTDIAEISYIYRLVDNIYKYKFISTAVEDESSKELFGAISAAIDKINSL